MVSVDGSVFIQIVNFIFLIWVLNTVLYKPIRNIISQRKERIAGFEQDIATLNQNADERDGVFVAGIRAARLRGLEKKEKLVADAAEEEKKIIKEINETARADLAEVREKIEKDAAEVRQSLEKNVDDFAETIWQKILGRVIE